MSNTWIIIMWLSCAPAAYLLLRWCVSRLSTLTWQNGDAMFWVAFCLLAGPIAILVAVMALIDITGKKLNIWKGLSDWMSRPSRW